MNGRNLTVLCLVVWVLPTCLFAQATFSVGGEPTPAADIGLTELTGALTLTVISGATVAAPLRIDYSAPITNNSASEISVTGSGGLSGVAPSPILDETNNFILIDVPAGGVPGDRISIQGVRVAPVNLNFSRVTATISSVSPSGNAIVAGQTAPVVISGIFPPFTVDLRGDQALAFSNGIVIHPSTSLVIKEGFLAAFTSSVGTSGQNVPTRFRITPFPSIPAGVRLTFAATAKSPQTGATLTTSSGTDETIPRANGSTAVVYQFSAAPNSNAALESFRIKVTLAIEPPAHTGTITFQTALFPIGAAKPTAELPSTDIPRFAERLVPDETDLATGSVELAFPFSAGSDATFTGIAMTNPQDFRVSVTLTALDGSGAIISGPNITNPVTLIVPRKGQVARLAPEVFGSGFNPSAAGTILARGKTSVLPGFYLTGDAAGPRLDGAIADLEPIQNFVFPVVSREGPSPFTLLEFFNPQSTPANAALNLFDSDGRLAASKTLTVGSSATVNRTVAELFSVDLNAFTGGYIIGRSDVPLLTRESFGGAAESNVLTGQVGFQQSRIYVAHFAAGGGFTTELNFVNLETTQAVGITLTALDDSGVMIGGGTNPVRLSLKPGAQVIRTVEDLFKITVAALITGYIRADVDTSSLGPFTWIPKLAGSVRFSALTGAGSASLPVFIPPLKDFVYSHVAQNADFYTGVAALNTSPTATPVTLEVFDKEGISTGTFSTTMQPGQKIAKLIYELIPAVSNQLGGYIRVHTSQPITSFSLFGDTKGLSLSTIPPQRIE